VPLGGFRESTVAEAPTEQITQLLRDWSQGDQRALDALGPLVYQYLQEDECRSPGTRFGMW
jgi:hypothetical protein